MSAFAAAVLLGCGMAQGLNRGDVVWRTDFREPAAYQSWAGQHRILKDGDNAVLRISNPEPKATVATSKVIPVSGLQGCSLECTALVKAENVSGKPNPWNGVKYMLVVSSADGNAYPQAPLDTGSFDWQKVSFSVRIPATATNLQVILGLEQVSGTAWFDELQIRVSRLPAVAASPRPGTRYTGHSVERLRGVMISPNIDEAGLRVLGEDWNVNLIRWQLIRHHPPGQPAPLDTYDTWLAAELDRVDRALPICKRYGIRVALDLHSPPGGKATEHGYVGATDRFFTDPACQAKFVEIWQHMARRYRGNPVIWGFDLVNEPVEDHVSFECDDWQTLAERAGRAIREIDPDRTLIVEPARWGGPGGFEDLSPINLDKVVYSFHMYEPHQFTHQQLRAAAEPISYPGTIAGRHWDRAALERALQPAIEFQKRYNVHLYVGEFSVIRWAPGDSGARYLRDLTEIFESHGWDWSYHAFREFHGWSVEHGADRTNTRINPVETDRAAILKAWFRKNQPER